MKAIVLEQPFQFSTSEVPKPKPPQSDEAMVRVHRLGICGTDLHAYKGEQPFFSYPRILGHELGVEVVAVGDQVKHVQPGDRCAVEPYRNERNGQAVRRGKPNCGEFLSVLGVHEDGGMREYFTYPAQYLHPSSLLTYEQLALVEPLGIGCHAVNRARLSAQDTVLVIGVGPIGLATAQFAAATGAQVVAIDLSKTRLEFCEAIIPGIGIIHPEENPIEAMQATFQGELPSVVFDATGNPTSMMRAFHYVAHGGTLVFIGLCQGDISFHDPMFHKKEMTLMASRNALPADFRQIIQALELGHILTSPWITHQVRFGEMIAHFDSWLRPETRVVKAMVEFC